MTPTRTNQSFVQPLSHPQPPWSPNPPKRTVSRMLAEVDTRAQQHSQYTEQEIMPPSSQRHLPTPQPMIPPSQPVPQTSQSVSTTAQKRKRTAPKKATWDGVLTEQIMLTLINDDSFMEEVKSNC